MTDLTAEPHLNELVNTGPHPDPVGEILHQLRLSGVFYCQADLTAPWGIDIPAQDDVMAFLVITEGHCHLRIEGQSAISLDRGDLVLMATDAPRQIYSDPTATISALSDLPVQKINGVFELLRFGGGGETARALYGIVRLNHATGESLLEMLPTTFKIDTWDAGTSLWLQTTLQFIAQEAMTMRPGGDTVVTRLADVIVIEAIRRWINTAPEARNGWLRGIRDPRIGPALLAIHRAPAKDWTLQALAKTAGLSRSAFSARFTDIVGQPAMQYLATWRMRLARLELTETSKPIAVIAEDVGYKSEPAFSRAFKRIYKIPPQGARQL